VNNAGSSPLDPDLPSNTQAYYDKVHGLNARGPVRLATVVGARMHDGHGGSIMNVSSTGSLRAGAYELVYSMAKAGMNQLTQGLIDAYGPKVRANTVLPAGFATDLAEQARWLTGARGRWPLSVNQTRWSASASIWQATPLPTPAAR
jgi:NAD(P)-dependent dehydrogenase (short-subunit alcohol dehydrogenase family)